MGMIQYYLRVDQKLLESFLQDSKALVDVVYSKKESDDYALLDLDKAWEGIFYLVTGSSLADAFTNELPQLPLLFGPSQIDPELDMGYGPATFTTPEQTKEMYNIIKDLSRDELTSRFDSDKMFEQDLYPDIWDDENALEYLLDFFEDLKGFYKDAVENNQAMVMYLS
ncbi:YfbM family protein [Sphingobacterium tabacisoli]|uniref:YfbM family protein n=1 Tax=Sphingobacterium tabacisoli TaxID=2044855 RepID=A0ABW5L0S7_9SPHI|nr:YfbM family protein [Sphingobacterium tabacisoli]